MGFDVTFHPVSARELQHFVFDVLDDPSLLRARMAEVTDDDDTRAIVHEMFEQTLVAMDREAAGVDQGEPEDDDDDELHEPCEMLRFLSAMVAGCRHPYWIARGSGLSLLRDVHVEQRFRPLGQIGTGRIQTVPESGDGNGFIGNWSATGFMLPADVAALGKALSTDAVLRQALGEWGTKSLGSALRYAETRGLGLIEATDVWSVAEQFSDPRNLRGVGTPSRPPPATPAPAAPDPTLECPSCGVFHIPGTTMCECGRDLRSTVPTAPPNRNVQGLLIIGGAVLLVVGKAIISEVRPSDFFFAIVLAGNGIFMLRR